MEKMQKRKNMILLGIITMIVICIAVSVYGVIRDIGPGETVFVISPSLPGAEDINRKIPILDRIKKFFKPQDKVIVPVEKKVTIKGKVVYTNGTPYANGMVELRSEPRTTYTDSEGNFIFDNVADGEHTINVVNQNKQVMASCGVSLNRNQEHKDAVMVQMPDDTFVLEVAVDVKVLEIVLEIEQSDTGLPDGKLIINPDVKVAELYTAVEQPETPPVIDEPTIPPVDPPPSPPGTPEKGRDGSGSVPITNALAVYTTGDTTNFNQTPAAAAIINIFGSGKRIAPGMTGVYKFTVDNTANSFAIYYDIKLAENDNSLNIPMKYRLHNNTINTYVIDSNWHSTAEISAVTADVSAPLTMSDSMKTEYTLEWFWDDGGINENSYAENHAGKVVCTLSILVSAQRK